MVGAKLVSLLMIRICVGGELSVKENYLTDPNRAVCHMCFKLNVFVCTEIERENWEVESYQNTCRTKSNLEDVTNR